MFQGIDVTVQTDGIELTNALKEYALQKLQKLARYNIINLKMLLKLDGLKSVVEVIADDTFISSRGDASSDMYHTIVKAVEVMSIALEKKKAKRSA